MSNSFRWCLSSSFQSLMTWCALPVWRRCCIIVIILLVLHQGTQGTCCLWRLETLLYVHVKHKLCLKALGSIFWEMCHSGVQKHGLSKSLCKAWLSLCCYCLRDVFYAVDLWTTHENVCLHVQFINLFLPEFKGGRYKEALCSVSACCYPIYSSDSK